MSVIFAEANGRVAVLPEAGLPLSLRLGLSNWPGYQEMKSIVTGVGIRSASNRQLLRSFRRMLYIFSFGDQPGELVISGLSFSNMCRNGQDDLETNPMTGTERVMLWYNRYRLDNSGQPLVINIGAEIAMPVYLVGYNGNISEPATGMSQFSLHFDLIPTGR